MGANLTLKSSLYEHGTPFFQQVSQARQTEMFVKALSYLTTVCPAYCAP